MTMTNNHVKIALIGEAGSGKDFIAGLLVDYFDFKRYAFADEVKRTAKRLFPDEYGNDSVKNRQLLIDIGMSMRHIDPYVWVDFLIDEMEEYPGNIVVTDTRLGNEYHTLKHAGFTIVRVNALPSVRASRIAKRGDLPNDSFGNHITETESASFSVHHEIDNNYDEKILAYAAISNLLADEFGIGIRFEHVEVAK